MRNWAFGLLLALTLAACDTRSIAQRRAEHLDQAAGDITVAVAWPLNGGKATLVNGITLATDEINSKGGVFSGRKVKLLLKDDEGALSTGRLVAQEIADNIDISAVIGHLNSYITEPAAKIYERAGLLLITPGASGQKITEHGGKLIFRNLPNNSEQGRQIADWAAAQGYHNIAIYYIKNDDGVDLANYFEQRADDIGLSIVDRRSYDAKARDHESIMADWAHYFKLDAVFLVGSFPDSADILRAAQSAGLKVPIFGGAGLDSPDLIRLGKSNAEGVVVFTLFNPNDNRENVQSFTQRYADKYGMVPDSAAAQGYDAMKLLAYAMRSAHSTDPAKVGTVLHSTKNWQGVTGAQTFDAKGDVVAKRLVMAVVKDGRFFYPAPMPAVEISRDKRSAQLLPSPHGANRTN
ncbi:ABC transporter substrate-binding protein [Massilia pinisoli]|uniref:ABC transporter substrate-binding protein n=1 Tax=Massilia pinisoli TaxID=1772194 RepID=A0ABT1ZUF1_9BURK|nr:ABC transporter substrate-binding protein [Massilia pinisoli]MCS0583567.1 ABC transporter substrate-binding protein [Massilia pinisoli]